MAQQINLFNPIFLQQKKHFSAVTMLQALGLLLAGILVFYAYASFETHKFARVAENSRKQLQTQSEQLASFMRDYSPQGRSKALEQELARIAAQVKQGEDLAAMMRTGALGNTEGFARYLSALARQTMAGVWITGMTIGGDEVELQLGGRVLRADLVPAYVRALNHEDVMRGRRIAEMRLTAREEVEAPLTAAPGAGAPTLSAKAPALPPPLRYVEFNILAVRGTKPPSPGPAAKGTP
jgi:hypothetical protein